MTLPLLILHNGTQRTGSEHLAARACEAGLEPRTFWAYGDEFPEDPTAFCGALVTGSPHGVHDGLPFIARECLVLREIAERRVPALGLCFGTQILAAALCGMDQVFRRSTCEVGFKPLPLAPGAADDPLLEGVADPLWMLVWHNDEVRHDHPDMRILASSDACPNQIWRWRDAPVWGVQGHPEVTAEIAPAWLGTCRSALAKDGADTDALIRQSGSRALGVGLVDNFLAQCRSGIRRDG